MWCKKKKNAIIAGYGGFHKRGIPKMIFFIMGNPIAIDDLGVPLFQETSI